MTALEHESHYAIGIMPYVIASMNVEAPSIFRLPAFSSQATESSFKVEVIGDTSFTNNRGKEETGYLVKTYHGGVNIDWYIDRENAPCLKRAVWLYQSGSYAGRSSVYEPQSYAVFDGDIFTDVVRSSDPSTD